MKTSKFTESQIVKSLRELVGGRNAQDICRELGISSATFYQWKRKYGGMEARDLRRLKDLEHENSPLKRLLADTILDKEILKDLIEKKKGWGPTSGGSSSR
jgi:putative transposase